LIDPRDVETIPITVPVRRFSPTRFSLTGAVPAHGALIAPLVRRAAKPKTL
jgi:hypothetical protein